MKQEIQKVKRPITGVYPILRFALDKGIESRLILEGTGLNENDLLDLKNDIFVEQEFRITRNLIKLAPEPETPWDLGQYFNTNAHGILGDLVASAPTIGDFVGAIIEFDIISSSYFRLYSEIKNDRMRVYPVENYIPDDLLSFLIERDISAGISATRSRFSADLNEMISAISFSHPERTDPEKYRQVFVNNILFNQSTTFIDVYLPALDFVLPGNHQKSFVLLRQQCQLESSLKREDRFFVSDKVKLYIQMKKGNVNLPETAKWLKMSKRSLSRVLSEEGTSFRKIRNQYIFQQSLYFLKDPEMTVERVADELGFSETCAFSRAFQKWTGITPSQYKKSKMNG